MAAGIQTAQLLFVSNLYTYAKQQAMYVYMATQLAKSRHYNFFLLLSEDADCLLMKDGIVDRHDYDEKILAKIGTAAEKKLGE